MPDVHEGDAAKALIAPSILAADFGRLAEQVAEAEEAGADWIHVDVMDGHFVPNISIGPAITEAVRRATELPVDVHLMIEAPQRYVERFVGAGADRVTVHEEVCPHLHRVVQQIRAAGAEPGVAVNPATPVESLREIVADLDLVLIMTVNPGFGGQAFIPGSVDKVRRTVALISEVGSRAQIQVDGGITQRTIGSASGAGAKVHVAGSAVFRHPQGVRAGMAALRSALAEGEAPAP